MTSANEAQFLALLRAIERGVVEHFYENLHGELVAEMNAAGVDFTDKELVRKLDNHFFDVVAWSEIFKTHE